MNPPRPCTHYYSVASHTQNYKIVAQILEEHQVVGLNQLEHIYSRKTSSVGPAYDPPAEACKFSLMKRGLHRTLLEHYGLLVRKEAEPAPRPESRGGIEPESSSTSRPGSRGSGQGFVDRRLLAPGQRPESSGGPRPGTPRSANTDQQADRWIDRKETPPGNSRDSWGYVSMSVMHEESITDRNSSSRSDRASRSINV